MLQLLILYSNCLSMFDARNCATRTTLQDYESVVYNKVRMMDMDGADRHKTLVMWYSERCVVYMSERVAEDT